MPDATTLLKFRHLFEEHKIGEQIFEDLKLRLDKAGLLMHGGTIVDATIIHAPSSTKNAKGKRDEEMHRVKKGNQWHFGMTVHDGVDAGTGFVHTITGTSANVHDSQQISELIRPDDAVVYGDSGYHGESEQEAIKSDENFPKIEFRINKRPSSLKIKDCYKGENRDKKIERSKSSIRCKVEHSFLIVKRYFGYCKVAYKGIEDEHEQIQPTLCVHKLADVYPCQTIISSDCRITVPQEERKQALIWPFRALSPPLSLIFAKKPLNL